MIAEWVFSVAKVVATRVADGANSVLATLEMMGGAETSGDEPTYGPLGFVGRPLPPDANGAAEAFVARFGDNAPVLGVRDPRITKAHGAVAEGAMGLTGYGGGFVRIDHADDGTDIATIYVPAERDGNGTVTKAHGLSMAKADVILAHCSGASVIAKEDGTLVLKSDTGAASITLKGDVVSIKANSIVIQGNVAAGGDPAAALPLSPTSVSQSVRFAP